MSAQATVHLLLFGFNNIYVDYKWHEMLFNALCLVSSVCVHLEITVIFVYLLLSVLYPILVMSLTHRQSMGEKVLLFLITCHSNRPSHLCHPVLKCILHMMLSVWEERRGWRPWPASLPLCLWLNYFNPQIQIEGPGFLFSFFFLQGMNTWVYIWCFNKNSLSWLHQKEFSCQQWTRWFQTKAFFFL